MARKSFTTQKSSRTEPISFEIGGEYADGTPLPPVEFLALPDVPGRYITDTVAKLNEGRELAIGELTAFIERCLLDDAQRQKFISFTNDPKILVSGEMLSEVMRWLMEEYGQRPLGSSQNSSTGASPMPTTSQATGQPPASTPWSAQPPTS